MGNIANNDIDYNTQDFGSLKDQEMALLQQWMASGADPASRPETVYFDNRMIDSMQAGGPSGATPVPGSLGGAPPPVNPPNQPPPGGGGGGGGGGEDPFVPPNPNPGDTDIDWDYNSRTPRDQGWKWDAFRPGGSHAAWGGYDPEYGAFERYVPGQESPWGNPNYEGGNQEFYQQQMANLLRDEQGYRNRARDSQARAARAEAERGDLGTFDYQTMWEGMGVTPNRAVQEDASGQYSWIFNPALGGNVTPGETTNYELYSRLSQQLSPHDQQIMAEHFSDPVVRDDLNWARAGDPGTLMAGMSPDNSPGFRDVLSNMFNTIYGRSDVTTPAGGGPTPATGYASPI